MEPRENQEIYRRLDRLEATDEKMNDALAELLVNTKTMNLTLENLANVLPRLRQLELDNVNTKLVVGAIKWLAVTAGGSAVVMVLSFLFAR